MIPGFIDCLAVQPINLKNTWVRTSCRKSMTDGFTFMYCSTCLLTSLSLNIKSLVHPHPNLYHSESPMLRWLLCHHSDPSLPSIFDCCFLSFVQILIFLPVDLQCNQHRLQLRSSGSMDSSAAKITTDPCSWPCIVVCCSHGVASEFKRRRQEFHAWWFLWCSVQIDDKKSCLALCEPSYTCLATWRNLSTNHETNMN